LTAQMLHRLFKTQSVHDCHHKGVNRCLRKSIVPTTIGLRMW
jgi:hypothetical protein